MCPGHVSGWLAPTPNYTFPVPTPRQLDWMAGTDEAVGGFSMFSHFGINTFWREGDKVVPPHTTTTTTTTHTRAHAHTHRQLTSAT